MVMNVDTAGAGSGIPVSADIKIRSQSEAAVCSTAILDFSRRGKPTDNATIESFNGRFREECLNVHWFPSLEDGSRRSTRFGGTTMSIILTDLSRVSALGNSLKGCSQRPQTHRRSGPRNPVPSKPEDLSLFV
jgi:hypothetical protein